MPQSAAPPSLKFTKADFEAGMKQLDISQKKVALDTFRELLAKQIGVQPRQIGSSRFSTRAGDVLLEGLNKHPDARIEGVSDAMAAGMWRAALVAGQNSPKEYNAPSR